MKTFCKLTTQSPAASYVPLPRFLLQDDALRDISNDAKVVHRQQKAKSARKRRSGVDNSGGEKPVNCKPTCTAEAARQYDFPRAHEIAFYLST